MKSLYKEGSYLITFVDDVKHRVYLKTSEARIVFRLMTELRIKEIDFQKD
jgi:hypothetical protein